ncbi:site-specific integrase [bacterium]|nr:site-specific integrase [bacterium]
MTISCSQCNSFLEDLVKQAKTLTDDELDQVLSHVKQRSHSSRNRAMILMTFWGGFRVGEVAALQYGDVYDDTGAVKPEIRLDAAVTKGKHARTVFLPEKLRAELAAYQPKHPSKTADSPLFQTQKSSERGFSANTATQLTSSNPVRAAQATCTGLFCCPSQYHTTRRRGRRVLEERSSFSPLQ